MPQFQYDPPAPNPAALSIAELMLRSGDINARAKVAAADANARAVAANGDVWGRTISGIGNTIAGTIQQQTDPRRQLEQIQLKDVQDQHADENALKTLQTSTMPNGPMAEGETRQAQNPYLKKEGDTFVWDTAGLNDAMAAQGRPLSPALLKSITDFNETNRQEVAHRQQYAATQQKLVGQAAGILAGFMRAHPDADPNAIGQMIGQQFAVNGSFPADQFNATLKQVTADPATTLPKLEALSRLGGEAPIKLGDNDKLLNPNDPSGPPLASNVVPKQPTAASLAAAANDPTKPPAERAAAKKALDDFQAPAMAGRDTAAAAQAETARHNAELERIAGLTQGRESARDAEIRRHNLASESQNEAAPTLTPEAIALTARQFAMTGQLPPMGMGKQGAKVRTDIINAAAAQYKGLDLPTQVAAFKANQDSLKKLQGQRDAIGAFESTATKNIDLFLDTAGKVVDTGSPLLNTPLRLVTGRLLGSSDQAAFDAARQVAVNEIAKITSNPTLSGTLSDSARHEVEAFNPQSATLKQSVAVMRLLKQDMGNRVGSLDDQIKAIQQRIATPPGTSAATGTKADPLGIR